MTITDNPKAIAKIHILRDVQEAAKGIWSWGPGATKSKTLGEAVTYYVSFACRPASSAKAAQDYVGRFVPGGVDADLSTISRSELRGMMTRCRVAAQLDEKRLKEGTV